MKSRYIVLHAIILGLCILGGFWLLGSSTGKTGANKQVFGASGLMVTDLTAMTTPVSADLLYIVNTASNLSQKITYDNLKTAITTGLSGAAHSLTEVLNMGSHATTTPSFDMGFTATTGSISGQLTVGSCVGCGSGSGGGEDLGTTINIGSTATTTPTFYGGANFGAQVSVTGTIVANPSIFPARSAGTIIGAASSTIGALEVDVQNTNPTGTSGFIAYANNSAGSDKFIEMGINGSDPNGTFGAFGPNPGNAYLLSTYNDLWVGTAASSTGATNLILAASGTPAVYVSPTSTTALKPILVKGTVTSTALSNALYASSPSTASNQIVVNSSLAGVTSLSGMQFITQNSGSLVTDGLLIFLGQAVAGGTGEVFIKSQEGSLWFSSGSNIANLKFTTTNTLEQVATPLSIGSYAKRGQDFIWSNANLTNVSSTNATTTNLTIGTSSVCLVSGVNCPTRVYVMNSVIDIQGGGFTYNSTTTRGYISLSGCSGWGRTTNGTPAPSTYPLANGLEFCGTRFNATTTQYHQWSTILPLDYVTGTALTFRPSFATTGTTIENNAFSIRAVVVTSTDAFSSVTFGSWATSTVLSVGKDFGLTIATSSITVMPGGSAIPGGTIYIEARTGSDASQTIGTDLILSGIKGEYQQRTGITEL